MWPGEIFLETNDSMFNISIIAVHGLHGDGKKTWTTDHSKVCWLKDLLPLYFKTAAIVSYGYNANVSSLNRSAKSKQDISSHAETMVAHLHAYRAVCLLAPLENDLVLRMAYLTGRSSKVSMTVRSFFYAIPLEES